MTMIIEANSKEVLELKLLTFAGGERHIQLGECHQVSIKFIEITAFISDSNGVIDLLLVVNALRHRYTQDLEINLVLPYMPYARQDRVCAEGQAFSLEVFAGLLASMRFNKITTWDCHSAVGVQLTGAINISAEKIIAASPKLVTELTHDRGVLICPDEGAKQRCKAIQSAFALSDMVQCYKKRDPITGKIIRTEVNVASLAGKTAVITDDICDGGFTFVKIAEQLKAKGAAKIILYVSHGIFSKGLDVFEGLIDEIYTTKSFLREGSDPRINEIQFG